MHLGGHVHLTHLRAEPTCTSAGTWEAATDLSCGESFPSWVCAHARARVVIAPRVSSERLKRRKGPQRQLGALPENPDPRLIGTGKGCWNHEDKRRVAFWLTVIAARVFLGVR